MAAIDSEAESEQLPRVWRGTPGRAVKETPTARRAPHVILFLLAPTRCQHCAGLSVIVIDACRHIDRAEI